MAVSQKKVTLETAILFKMIPEDIKILHLDSNHPLLIQQLQEAGFTNDEDFTATKETIEAKIHNYHGIIIRSRLKIDKTFLIKRAIKDGTFNVFIKDHREKGLMLG